MTNMNPMLCTICARGGSKGVPGKNIRPLAGIPLIGHSIRQARQAGLFAHIAVSSDSEEILRISREQGADILIRRPEELATDTAGKVPAIVHAVRQAEEVAGCVFPVVVDLSATSPLRQAADIVGAVALLERSGCRNVITGAPSHCSPYFSLVEGDAGGVVRLSKVLDRPVLRRQDSPRCFDMNGSIYVWRREALLESPAVFYDDTHLYEMPRARSLDIDDPLDFEMAEFLIGRSAT